MKKLFVVSGLVLAVFITTLSVINLVLVVGMAIPAYAAEIGFCQNNKTGVLTFVPASGVCPKTATLVQINSAGVVGPQGPKGDTGATGATGPQGSPGVANGISVATHGFIASNATIASGSDFSVQHTTGSGKYTIYFNNAFQLDPTCLLVGWTNANVACYNMGSSPTSLAVWCVTYPWQSGNSSPNDAMYMGNYVDAPFGFICVQ